MLNRPSKVAFCFAGFVLILAALWSINPARGQQSSTPLEPICSFYGHMQDAIALALHKNGKAVAIGGPEGKIALWSIPDQKRLGSVTLDARMVIALAYSPDGRVLAASALPAKRDQPSFIALMDSQSLKPLVRINLVNEVAYSVSWSSDGSSLAAGCGSLKQQTGVIRLYGARDGAEICTLTGTERWNVPKFVKFSPDGVSIAAGGTRGVCELWNVPDRKLQWSVKAYPSDIYGLAFSPHGETIATIARDYLDVNLWDVASGERKGQLVTRGELSGVSFSPSGKTIAVSSHTDRDQMVLWNSTTLLPQATLSMGRGINRADCVNFNQQGNLLVTLGRNSIYCWNVSQLEDPQYARQLRFAQFPKLKALHERVQANPVATEFTLAWGSGALHGEELGIVAELKNLRKLTIACLTTNERNWVESDVFLQLKQLPEFQELVLQNVVLNSLRGPSQLSHLKRLALHGECRINSWPTLKLCEQIEELDLRGGGITDNELGYLSTLRSLKTLRLAGTVNRPQGSHDYFGYKGLSAIEQLSALEVLELSGNAITKEAGQHLKGLVNLRELKIAMTGIDHGCTEALAAMSKLEIAELPSVGDDALLVLATLPSLRKISIGGQGFSDYGLEQVGRLKGLQELSIGQYWTPGDALQYARDLGTMSRDELQTYELMRSIIAQREYQAQLQKGQRQAAAWAGVMAAAIPRAPDPAVRVDNPSHPRYSEHLASRRAISKLYQEIGDEKRESADFVSFLEQEALRMAEKAFADRPAKRDEIQARIRGMAKLK